MFPLRCNKTQNSFLTLIPLHSSLEERNLCNPHMCIFKIHFIFSNFCNFLYDNNKVNNKEHNIKFWQETSEIQNICIFWSDLIEEQHSVTLRVWPPTQYQNFCQIPEFQFVPWRWSEIWPDSNSSLIFQLWDNARGTKLNFVKRQSYNVGKNFLLNRFDLAGIYSRIDQFKGRRDYRSRRNRDLPVR